MNKGFRRFVLLGLIAASPVLAHHSWPVFCTNKVERSTGVVQFALRTRRSPPYRHQGQEWQVGVAVDDEGRPTRLTNAVTPANRSSKAMITVTFNPALNGATIGFLDRSFADKKEVEFTQLTAR